MTDETSAAPAADAPVQPEPAPVDDAHPEPPAPSEPQSLSDTLSQAFDTVEKAESGAEPQPEPGPQETQAAGERQRGPDGRFLPKDGDASAAEQHNALTKDTEKALADAAPPPKNTDGNQGTKSEPPARFSEAAKAAWNEAPDAIKAEVHRAVQEMETGIDKYRGDAEKWQDLRQFEELAQANNVTVKDTMQRYVAADQLLSENLLGGLDQIAQMYGTNLHDIAAHVIDNMSGDNELSADPRVAQLEKTITELRQQVSGVATTVQKRTELEMQREVEAFAAENNRFEELSSAIQRLLEKGMANTLPEAYSMAERLNPLPPSAPVPAAEPTPTAAPAAQAAPDLTAQTQKGSLSVTGAPASGSDPANRKAPSTARDALRQRFDEAGM